MPWRTSLVRHHACLLLHGTEGICCRETIVGCTPLMFVDESGREGDHRTSARQEKHLVLHQYAQVQSNIQRELFRDIITPSNHGYLDLSK